MISLKIGEVRNVEKNGNKLRHFPYREGGGARLPFIFLLTKHPVFSPFQCIFKMEKGNKCHKGGGGPTL